jgi:DNA-binding protein HU-beta
MNRAELVDAISKSTGHTKADSERWLAAFVDTVSRNIKKKEGVKLVGFGTFGVSARQARQGRNPQTGKVINIEARKVVRFKAGAELSETVK